jgi:hypothetical protein
MMFGRKSYPVGSFSKQAYFRTKILPITVGSLKSVPLGESM